jgi:hypothetical protein
VITLPRHLAPWAGPLALFPEEIALVLGPMVMRLAGILGGWPSDRAPEGSPNGYDGIGRRGPYDRLLATEWLLLEELPDEFLRRAVAAEHFFLQQAFQASAAARRSVVLFDAGPDQLGAPRIVHLALLIVLVQRATQNGASLTWGILQGPASGERTGATKAELRGLFAARCARPVLSEDIDRWVAAVAASKPSELWLVGAEPLGVQAKSRKASALVVTDVMEPGGPQRIRVAAAIPATARVREAVLEVPPAWAAVALMRDPFAIDFAARQTTSVQFDLQTNFIFSRDGRRLHLRGAGGALLTFHIPNSPRGKPGPPSAFRPPPGHSIIAVGQSNAKRRTIVLSQQDKTLAVHTLSKRGKIATQTEYFVADDVQLQLPLPVGDFPLQVLGVLGAKFCFVDAVGNLVMLDKNKFQLIDSRQAVASRAVNDGFVYLRLHHHSPNIRVARLDQSGEIQLTPVGVELAPLSDARYYFGASGLANLVAYSPSLSRCAVFHRLEGYEFIVPKTHTVVGLVERGSPGPQPWIIALDESRTRIEALKPGSRETLVTTAAPIAFAAASDAAPVVAFLTQSGELGVYSCAAKAMVLHATGEP